VFERDFADAMRIWENVLFLQSVQLLHISDFQKHQRSGTERAASPGNGAVQGVWGTSPTSKKLRFPAMPGTVVLRICGNKCTACHVCTEFGKNALATIISFAFS